MEEYDQLVAMAEDFDTWAEYYNSAPEMEALSTVAIENCRVLEVGCGSGRLTSRLSGVAEEYIAIDIESDLVRYTTNSAESIGVLASGEQLPFRAGAFDTIICGWALSAQDVPVALEEQTRVLQDSGQAVFITPSWDEPDRVNSEYVQALRIAENNTEYDELKQMLENPIRSVFDSVKREPITSSYEFPSIEAAVEAFVYHIEEYNNSEIRPEAKSELRNYLGSKSDQSSVVLSEHANVFYCQTN